MRPSSCTISVLASFLTVTALLVWRQYPLFPPFVWWVIGACVAASIVLILMGRMSSQLRSINASLMLCIFLGAGAAFIRVAQTTHVTMSTSVESFASMRQDGVRWQDLPQVTLHGTIVDEPDRRPMQTKYTIEVDTLQMEDQNRETVSGRMLVTDYNPWIRHEYGDEVVVRGILERPTVIEDFHYDRYLSRYDIYTVMYRGSIETMSKGHGSALFSRLYSFKDKFEKRLNRLYPEPYASFMAGLLTGSRRGIPEHLLDAFRRTGLTHIIAISGYNITIVISVITAMFFFLPLQWRFIPSIVAITIFTLFVGASPSVVRAAIMGGLGLLALQTGRERDATIAILLSAALMVAWNPKILWYDAGFQLSFLAVLGLTYIAPMLENRVKSIPNTLALRDSLLMTISAQITAVPLIVVLFGQLSLVAPIANILVAPLIPFAMLFGFAAVIVSMISLPLGLAVAYPGWGALELIIRISQGFSSLNHASVILPGVSVWWVAGYYVVLFACHYYYIHKQTPLDHSSSAA